jgi:hypothetical protein
VRFNIFSNKIVIPIRQVGGLGPHQLANIPANVQRPTYRAFTCLWDAEINSARRLVIFV